MLLYAAEIWTVNKEDEKRLLVFEMRCYRRILAVKWQDRRTNEEIRAVVRVQRKETVMDTIRISSNCLGICHVHFHSVEVARVLFARWREWRVATTALACVLVRDRS